METKSPDRRRSIHRPFAVIGVLAIIGLIGGSAALASHSFVDVPNDHTFHNDIEWMKDTGVTRGCNPPANTEYCPNEFTTRGQMAAFFHRFSDAGVVNAGTLDGRDSTDFLGVNDKAADSDLLDGFDSTDFARADAPFGDADTLDGRDSTDFLGVDDKAADSDLLDGLDSTAFVQTDGLGDALGASVYINTAIGDWLLAINNEVVASCEAGDVLIGGGYQTDGDLEVNVEDNYPDGEDWIVRGTAAATAEVTAYAICVGS